MNAGKGRGQRSKGSRVNTITNPAKPRRVSKHKKKNVCVCGGRGEGEWRRERKFVNQFRSVMMLSSLRLLN